MTQTASTHSASFPSDVHDRQRVSDPDRVAHFEKAGWEAYYDRKWLRVLRLMVQNALEAEPPLNASELEHIHLWSGGLPGRINGHARPALVAFNDSDRYVSLWQSNDTGDWVNSHLGGGTAAHVFWSASSMFFVTGPVIRSPSACRGEATRRAP